MSRDIQTIDWLGPRPEPTYPLGYLGPIPKRDSEDPRFGQPVPQAFLVPIAADATLRTHFHDVDQFQYFATDDGTFGRHHVQRGVAHYVDRFTPYGPLEAGANGVAFFTLRAISNKGAFYMPESRADLASMLSNPELPSPRRNLTFDLTLTNGPDGTWQSLVADADGLRIAVVASGRNQEVVVPAIAGAGAYLIIVDGSLDADQPVGVNTIAWRTPGPPAGPVVAGDEGVRLALLQFPAFPEAVR